ncbi:MAG: helix-turn-helix domain-containing protein [Actinomycetota bacterium]|nr:helix-turn-helix domain-containing protein [Actinomycetota bacterium]
MADRQPPGEVTLAVDRTRRLVPVETAAAYLGVSRATIERLVHRGELPFVKVGGSTRYDVDDLDGYIDTNRRRNRRQRNLKA